MLVSEGIIQSFITMQQNSSFSPHSVSAQDAVCVFDPLLFLVEVLWPIVITFTDLSLWLVMGSASQECKNPRTWENPAWLTYAAISNIVLCLKTNTDRRLWPWPLIFWLRNKWVSGTHHGTCVCQVWWS